MSAQRAYAIIGAGIAGAATAAALAAGGARVVVFDKSRGVGGRLSTRRADFTAADGTTHPARFDHGAQFFTARDPAFLALIARGLDEGFVAPWLARIQDDLPEAQTRYVACPDMPQLARHLLDGLEVRVNAPVSALARLADGWQVAVNELAQPERFDGVVLANPPLQAAPLIAPHDPALAARLEATPMLPCWTLMAITDEPREPIFDAARIQHGPLAWAARNDAKPGRPRIPGHAQWVAQAVADWSSANRDTPKERVEALLREALAEALGEPATRFHHASVHRWLYAQPAAAGAGPQWDAALSIGVCGDHCASGRIEAAWLSGTQLARDILAAK